MEDITTRIRPVKATALAKQSKGELTVRLFSRRERIVRALKAGGLGLVGTIAVVFIPIAHFVLVPLGAILTPIVALVTFRQTSQILSASIQCPACGAAVTAFYGKERYPLFEFCPKCRREVSVVLLNSGELG